MVSPVPRLLSRSTIIQRGLESVSSQFVQEDRRGLCTQGTPTHEEVVKTIRLLDP